MFSKKSLSQKSSCSTRAFRRASWGVKDKPAVMGNGILEVAGMQGGEDALHLRDGLPRSWPTASPRRVQRHESSL
jgi:hypothetical protein